MFGLVTKKSVDEYVNIYHRVDTELAIATFWRTIHHDGKISPAW
jgi:hypothetical protein